MFTYANVSLQLSQSIRKFSRSCQQECSTYEEHWRYTSSTVSTAECLKLTGRFLLRLSVICFISDIGRTQSIWLHYAPFPRLTPRILWTVYDTSELIHHFYFLVFFLFIPLISCWFHAVVYWGGGGIRRIPTPGFFWQHILTSVIINKQGTFRPFATPLCVYPPPF